MAHFFREPDRRQRFLLPVDMMDWLPEGDIVHVVVDGVGLGLPSCLARLSGIWAWDEATIIISPPERLSISS